MKEQKFLSVVLYIYNSSEELKRILLFLYNFLSEHFEHSELICVNDGSTDSSREIVEKTIQECRSGGIGNDLNITIINMGRYQGIELAMNAGVDLSIGDFIMEIDSFAWPYKQELIIDVYYKLVLDGYDIVAASPNKIKKLSSRAFYFSYNLDCRKKQHSKLRPEGFHIISRRAINRTKALYKKASYRKAVYAECGLKKAAVFYEETNLSNSQYSSIESTKRIDLAMDTLILHSNIIQRLSLYISIILLLVTIGIGAYTVISYIWGRPVEGWTPLMLFLSGGFVGIFLILTIILKYFSVLLHLIFKEQSYLIESIDKVTNI